MFYTADAANGGAAGRRSVGRRRRVRISISIYTNIIIIIVTFPEESSTDSTSATDSCAVTVIDAMRFKCTSRLSPVSYAYKRKKLDRLVSNKINRPSSLFYIRYLEDFPATRVHVNLGYLLFYSNANGTTTAT